jgi:hypothetical protein
MDSKVKVCFITAFETYYEKFNGILGAKGGKEITIK